MDQLQMPPSDHDLLIRLDTKMDRQVQDTQLLGKNVDVVRHEVSVLNQTMEAKIAAAVSGKADTIDLLEMKKASDIIHEDFEKRLRVIERYMWIAIGVVALGEVVLGVILKIW